MAKQPKVIYPRCFGLAYDQSSQDCQCCLLNEVCLKAYLKREDIADEQIQSSVGMPARTSNPVPENKKMLILAICEKYGIDPVLNVRGKGPTRVEPSNVDDWIAIDAILTSKDALEVLYNTQLKNE